MQIGEFALLCDTKISVLRHYDKEGLLKPDYVDRFTGYRYYSEEQAAEFFKIGVLKEAGFSLSDIKSILRESKSPEEISSLFDEKRRELKNTLSKLDNAKRLLDKTAFECPVYLCEEKEGTMAQLFCPDPQSFDEKCDELDIWLCGGGYQRISPFRMYAVESGCEVSCSVIKLRDSIAPLLENCDITFEDDPHVKGEWIACNFVCDKDDFDPKVTTDFSLFFTEVSFLENGKIKSTFSNGGFIESQKVQTWTRGFVLQKWDSCACAYEIRTIGNREYLFIEWKSGDYIYGGMDPNYYVFERKPITER